MIFGGMQKSSTIDFPGRLCCVLFARGCDLSCFYCHNRSLIPPKGPCLLQADIDAFLQKRRGLLDGVAISGGEPTLQADLPDTLRQIRSLGYQTKLDTNGQRPGAVAALLEQKLLDYVALDIKALPSDYPAVTGKAGFEAAAKTAKVLSWGGAAYELRTTLYPGMDIPMLEQLLAAFPPQPCWRLNYFRHPEACPGADALRLRQPALTPGMLLPQGERLRRIQPNLVL